MFSGEINAINNLIHCKRELATMSGELNVRFIAPHLKYHLGPAAWVLQGEIHAMNNLVHCNCELATMSDEVNVRFIALLSPLDRTQGPVY